MTLIDWIKIPNNSLKNGFVGWKSKVWAFPLIGNWIAWKIGNGKIFRLGEDPWAGVGENYKLPISVINKLREQRRFHLVDA